MSNPPTTTEQPISGADRSCATCGPCGSHDRKYRNSCCNDRKPLIVQCESPLTHPPRCTVEKGQVLLAVECGQFFYWGKKYFDDNDDGIADRCECCWLPVQCGECAPISFRQSQIFFYDCFTGAEEITGPPLDVDCDPARPKVGDYLIDCANHNLWLYDVDCCWKLHGKCFGSAIITLHKSVSPVVYNCTTERFELCYAVTVCNAGDCDYSSVTLVDNVRAQAEASGLAGDNLNALQIDFLSPTDLTFVNDAFQGAGPIANNDNSDVLVQSQPLPAFTCKTIEYRLSAPKWILPANECVALLRNQVSVTEALTDKGKDHAVGQHAIATAKFAKGVQGGQAKLSKKFGVPQINNATKSITVMVSLTVSNCGSTPIRIDSLVDDVDAALVGSSAFSSPGNPAARWVCGSGTLPGVNNSYNGKTSTNLLSGAFTLAPGASLAVDFDLKFEQAALALIDAESPLCNIAVLSFTDVLNETKECSAVDKFFCDECPQLSVHKEVSFVRPRKQRIDLFQGVPFNDQTQYEKAYEIELKYTFANTGCVTLCNVLPYLNIEDSMLANGVVGGQLGEIFNAQVTVVDTFPEPAPTVTANGSFTGTATSPSAANRLIAQTGLDLAPGQGFNVRVNYDFIPSNNSQRGAIDVAAPVCNASNVSGSLPAVKGDAALLVHYETVCQTGVQSMNLTTPLCSNDCPNITLEKSAVDVLPLALGFGSHSTDTFFQIDAYKTPPDDAGPTFLPSPPPALQDCFQVQFKYKVTNTGNVPLDQIRICDNFFDQLAANNGGGGPGICESHVLKPGPMLVAGNASGDDGLGSFAGNGGYTGFDANNGSYLGGGSGMLLPGSSIEFAVRLKFCIDPSLCSRVVNDARVLARAPNEALVSAESRGFVPIPGPSMCITKAWADGYPLEVVPGRFRGKLSYTVFNDGNQRLLDLELFDHFTQGLQTIDPASIAAPGVGEQGVRQRISPCDSVIGESNFNVAWNGSNGTTPVNTPKLPIFDRSEQFSLETPEFEFDINMQQTTTNTVTVCTKTNYTNPARNVVCVLTDLTAYTGYTGLGKDLGFGEFCCAGSMTIMPMNAIRNCPLAPQPSDDASPTIFASATIIDDTPGAVLYTIGWQLAYENSKAGSIVNVATVESISITSTTGLPSGVTSQSIAFVDPSPVAPGASVTLQWTETLLWTGSGNPPTMPYSTYDIQLMNAQNIKPAACDVVGEVITLPDPFVEAPIAPQSPASEPALLVDSTPGAVLYDVTYQYLYENGNTITEGISVAPTTSTYPSGITSESVTFVDPSTVAANGSVLLQWTERLRWSGADATVEPPIISQLTYDINFVHTAGLNATVSFVGNGATLPDPFVAPPVGPQTPTTQPATLVDPTSGAVLYDVTYQYMYANGNTATENITVTRTTVSLPAGMTSQSLTFVDPSTVAANGSVLLQWTERLKWTGIDYNDDPPTMPQLTYDMNFTHTHGLNATVPFVGDVVILPDPFVTP